MIGKLCFDIAALFIMLIILLYNVRRNTTKNKKNMQTFIVVAVALVSNVATITNSLMAITGNVNGLLYCALDTVDSIALALAMPSYMFYLIIFTGNEQKLTEYRKENYLISIPVAINVVFTLHYCFDRILNNTYMGSDSIGKLSSAIGYVVMLFYAAACLVYLYYYKKAVDNAKVRVLVIPIVLIVVSMGIHFLNPQTQSVFFVFAMSFLLLLFFNHSSTGIVDVETGFRTQTAFMDDMYIAQCMKREIKMILVRIINYNEAINRSGYEEVRKAILQITKSIDRIIEDNLIDGEDRFYDDAGSFIITLPTKYNDNVELLANDLKRLSLEGVDLGSVDFALLTNVCIVSFPQDAQDADTILLLLSDLDNVGHASKVLFASDITSKEEFNIRKRMNIIIDRGLKNGYFSVYYQPIFDLKSEKFKSAEALIRLNDPEYGFISPGVFIPIAEKTGAIHAIGSFVLEKVVQFIASEEFKRLEMEYIEVNLSAAQCLRVDLAEEISTITKKYDVNPRRLNLEITETAECYSQDVLLGNIRALHNMGYSFSLDDFGTGYSNLMRMASLPIDLVKLDRAFVLMDNNDRFHSIIKNMVRLFKDMGLSILVEGVETIQMVEKFRDIDVDYIQGFYYSRPLPKDDFVAFIRSHLG